MAKLYFRYGAMGSSKTANAVMVQYNYRERGCEVLMLKPRLENRDGATLVRSRCGLEAQCRYVEDLDTINQELERFDPELAKRPMLVAGNKCDLASDEQLAAFEEEMKKRGFEYFPLMAAIAHGTDELVNRCAALLAELPQIRAFEAEPVPLMDVESIGSREIRIEQHEGVFFVEGEWLLKLLQTVDIQDPDGLQYFERVLQSSGVIRKLEEAGVQEGDTVSIYDLEFDFVN